MSLIGKPRDGGERQRARLMRVHIGNSGPIPGSSCLYEWASSRCRAARRGSGAGERTSSTSPPVTPKYPPRIELPGDNVFWAIILGTRNRRKRTVHTLGTKVSDPLRAALGHGVGSMRISHPIFLLAVLLGLIGTSVEGQTIRGVVVDAEAQVVVTGVETNMPVGGAEVELLAEDLRGSIRTVTDTLGFFSLTAPRAGVFGLRVRHPAYLPYDAEGIEVGQEEAVTLEIRLGKNVIPLEPLVVTARVNSTMAGFHERRTRGAFATFLTREEIEARAAGRTTDLLRGLPGVRINFQRWGVGPAIEMQGGFGTCEPTVYVDGVRAPQAPGSMLDDFLTPDRIEGVEVYTSFSTAPAEFISGTCGVILFWTRRGGREGGDPWSWKRVLVGLAVAVGLIIWIR